MLFQPLPATCQTRVEIKGQTKASEEMVWSAHPIVQSPKGVSVCASTTQYLRIMPLSWPERLAPPVASKCQSGLQVSRAEMSLPSENLLLVISPVITRTFTYTS